MSRRIETIVSEIELILKQILDDDHYGEDWIKLSFECSRMIDFGIEICIFPLHILDI